MILTPQRMATLLIRITVLRIVLVPVVMALVLIGDRVDLAYVSAACLFVIAAGTDFVDGYLARRWNAATTLGSFLDTTADKLLVAGCIIALVAVDRASAWIAVIIVGRELVILGLRGMVALDGTVMPPSIWGKLKATVQFGAITLAIVRTSDPLGPLYLDEWAMIVAAAITVMSGVEYLARYSSALTSSRNSAL
ncbi:MAG: CDP-diacylglycerol--glycerol-3-phosphate 3-phosphatidyltransferase [Actinomycetota bacterium]